MTSTYVRVDLLRALLALSAAATAVAGCSATKMASGGSKNSQNAGSAADATLTCGSTAPSLSLNCPATGAGGTGSGSGSGSGSGAGSGGQVGANGGQASLKTHLQFSAPYSNRCPSDRVISFVTIRNDGTAAKTVKYGGSAQPLGGDGGCNQSYASLGLKIGQPIGSFGVAAVSGQAQDLGGGSVVIPPGGVVELAVGGGVGGGRGEVSGTLDSADGFDGLSAQGILSTVQDSTTPNVLANSGYQILTSQAATTGGGNVINFTAPYAARCPVDRTLGEITLNNAGTVTHTVTLKGGMRVLSGDGGCNQTYASLGLSLGQILGTYGVESVSGGAVDLGNGQIQLPPGATVLLSAGGGKGGGTGEFYGTITYDGPGGDIKAQGIISTVQDSTLPGSTNLANNSQFIVAP